MPLTTCLFLLTAMRYLSYCSSSSAVFNFRLTEICTIEVLGALLDGEIVVSISPLILEKGAAELELIVTHW